MRIFFRFLLFAPFIFCAYHSYATDRLESRQDPAEADRLNALAFESRLRNAEESLLYATRALSLSKKLDYTRGIAEAYRMRGLAKMYQNQSDSAVSNYFEALNYLKKENNQAGLAKTYNNIGSVYRDIKDYDKGLAYYKQSLSIAGRLGMKPLIAGLYLNMGIIYQKQGNISQALTNYENSNALFQKLEISEGLSSVQQSLSSIYKDLGDWAKAEKYAIGAIELAKKDGDSYIIASTNLTLSVVYISTGRYEHASRSIAEGMAYANLLADEKMVHDYLYRKYQLYFKQKDYENALTSLAQVYRQDSIHNDKYESDKIRVLQETNRRIETENKNQVLKEQERNSRIIFWASVLVMGLLTIVVVMLIRNVLKKAQTNKQLTALNQEISMQKENLDRINHNLEEIIGARTHDLKIKNKKLSEYSSHLSHQIRGPVATLKGLVNLNKEGLIENEEVIQQMEKCVYDIDDKILRINDMLHDPKQYGFSGSE
jgi:tetratricopeptide (TPR) repeat protein